MVNRLKEIFSIVDILRSSMRGINKPVAVSVMLGILLQINLFVIIGSIQYEY